eukprot:489331_1
MAYLVLHTLWHNIKTHYRYSKITADMDSDIYYVGHGDALAEPIIPHGSKDFATKTKGAMAYFIAVSGMIFIEKSNQEPCIKQIRRFMNLWNRKVKIMILWTFLEKIYFSSLNYNGKEHLVMKKIVHNMKR